MKKFSDYIVYVDESGDHGLKSIDQDFPLFALALCVMKKTDYAAIVVPKFQEMKFRYFGHDAVVFHEHEIRKEKNQFGFLRSNAALRYEFMTELNNIVESVPLSVFSTVIHKERLKSQYNTPFNPYNLALQYSLERLGKFLIRSEQANTIQHVVFECRGKQEDNELELEFRRICDSSSSPFDRIEFEPVFARKSVNSTGLQLADLMARPIALSVLRPNQPNRAFDIIQPKLENLKVFPK